MKLSSFHGACLSGFSSYLQIQPPNHHHRRHHHHHHLLLLLLCMKPRSSPKDSSSGLLSYLNTYIPHHWRHPHHLLYIQPSFPEASFSVFCFQPKTQILYSHLPHHRHLHHHHHHHHHHPLLYMISSFP
ncbi:hypothetical protein HanHA300_Chr11g0401071 [Helianthus annuus]|nr:hypothetical protein HanHA300_Chr11g0401071 [Helianthus annuus]KAJ0517374.1 hypothetical protein HanHA89_Chr11g0424631 [Helianthus annuus]KAJ0685381.1 hypothetical protein HanLR1_Chr11g0402041 [Helianthus annuus]KAJ0689277.1 hypothetical protein HanOQP8_Chr11g0403901 [Helianthus annuus]